MVYRCLEQIIFGGAETIWNETLLLFRAKLCSPVSLLSMYETPIWRVSLESRGQKISWNSQFKADTIEQSCRRRVPCKLCCTPQLRYIEWVATGCPKTDCEQLWWQTLSLPSPPLSPPPPPKVLFSGSIERDRESTQWTWQMLDNSTLFCRIRPKAFSLHFRNIVSKTLFFTKNVPLKSLLYLFHKFSQKNPQIVKEYFCHISTAEIC